METKISFAVHSAVLLVGGVKLVILHAHDRLAARQRREMVVGAGQNLLKVELARLDPALNPGFFYLSKQKNVANTTFCPHCPTE